jgi:hypothetical protein
MKTYPLVSFEYQGKRYSKCTLPIDEVTSQLEVSKPNFLGRGRTVIVRLNYAAHIQVAPEGSTIGLGGMLISTESLERANEISQLIGMGETPAPQQRPVGIPIAESAALEFLRARESTVSFLSSLKEHPKEALLSQSQMWTDNKRDPLDEILATRSLR